MAKECEISVEFKICKTTDVQICGNPIELNVCRPARGVNFDFCDLVYVVHEGLDECNIAVSSVGASGTTYTVNTTGNYGNILYRLLDSTGTIITNWQTANTFTIGTAGVYVIQVKDAFGCTDYYTLEIV